MIRLDRSDRIRLAIAAAILLAGFLAVHFGLLGGLEPARRAKAWERFGIHLFCGAAVAQLLRSALHGFERAGAIRELGPRLWFWLPVVIGPLVIFLREPWDVAQGGPLVKSYLDPVGWTLGLVADRFATGFLAARNRTAALQLQERKR